MASWEHFSHEADVGVAGMGPTKAEAFRQAAIALSSAPATTTSAFALRRTQGNRR